MQARQQGTVRARMSRSPRPRRAHIAQMLALGGRHSLHTSIKVQAKQREREKRHEAYKQELHEAVRNLPTLPAAPAETASHAVIPTSPTVHAAFASHATHTAHTPPVTTPAKTSSSAPPVASTVHAAGASPAAPILPVATSAPMGAPAPLPPVATPTTPAATTVATGTDLAASTPVSVSSATPTPAVSSATPTTTPVPAGPCDAHGYCHGIVTNYNEDAYIHALASCRSALAANLQAIDHHLVQGKDSLAFSLMATILVGAPTHSAPTQASSAVLASLLEGKMKVALPYFAIKDLFAASSSMSDGSIKHKHVLKILDICLAWHHKENKFDRTAIANLRREIATEWYDGRNIITVDEVSALRELAQPTRAADTCEHIPPKEFATVLQFSDDVTQDDRDWTIFALELLSADEVDIGKLLTDLRSSTRRPSGMPHLLGNVQAAGLLLNSRRIENPNWLETYLTECLLHLHTINSFDHETLSGALTALKEFSGSSKDQTRKKYIGHMAMVVETIRKIRTEPSIYKRDISRLVSGDEKIAQIAKYNFPENQHQKDLPRLFATEVLLVVKTSDAFKKLAHEDRMQIMKAFDAHFPNMDESTMFAVGDTWLDLAAKGVSSFGVPLGVPLEHFKRAKQKDKKPSSKRPSGLDETPESAAPSKVTVDARLQLVLDACNATGLDKPPRGAYLRVAPNCDDVDATRLRTCIENDLAFKKHFLDEHQNDRAIAGYLIQRIDTIRAESKAHFGRCRVARVSRPPYAMSPWTAV